MTRYFIFCFMSIKFQETILIFDIYSQIWYYGRGVMYTKYVCNIHILIQKEDYNMITRDLLNKILQLQPVSYSCLSCYYQQYDIPKGKTLEQLLNSENFNFLCKKCQYIHHNINISDFEIDCSNSSISEDGCICQLCFVNSEITINLSIGFNPNELGQLLENYLVNDVEELLTESRKKYFKLQRNKNRKSIAKNSQFNTKKPRKRVLRNNSGDTL